MYIIDIYIIWISNIPLLRWYVNIYFRILCIYGFNRTENNFESFMFPIKAVDVIMWRTHNGWLHRIHKTFERQKPRGFCFNLHPAYKIKSGKRRQPLVEKRPFMLLKIALGSDPWPAHMFAYDINQKRKRKTTHIHMR